jgi:heme-degrading monooxygenase HmoA
MVLEIAHITVKAGMEAEFEAAAAKAPAVFQRAEGCRAMTLKRSIEYPSQYYLMIEWETLENHTVDFRDSADFQVWRNLGSHCFASSPEVQHASTAVKGF